jgi:ribosomal protein S27E
MKINCISCGHKVCLDDVYDDYHGQIKCFVCNALLEIKTEDGRLKSVEYAMAALNPPTRAALETASR